MNMEQQPQFPPPPSADTSSYASGYATPTNNNPVSLSALADGSVASQHTTYVNIPLLPLTQLPSPPLPPPPPSSIAVVVGCSTPASGCGTPGATSTTSTFKTPLLPMPTLEDIEGGMSMQSVAMPQPVGILKYPTSTTTPTLGLGGISMSMSMNMGMGPGPPTFATTTAGYTTTFSADPTNIAASQPQQQPPPPATLSLSDAGTLKSNAKLLSLPPPSVAALLSGSAGGSSSHTNPAVASLSHHPPPPPMTNTTTTNAGVASGAASRVCSDNKNSNNSTATSSASRCCSCFGSSGHPSAATTKAHKKKHKQKTQTIWSALLTNLGICALLLAYTLLGSFIFLTIESEDSTLLHHHHHHHHHNHQQQQQQRGQRQHQQSQQRTLASTKRVGGNVENIYHTSAQQQQQQQQQQPVARLDNATMAAATSAYAAHTNMNALLEGIVPLNDDDDDDANGDTLADADADFIYDEDTNAAASATAQLALSADTYDVRQRTIENIWDITVSLNILYKENWTKLAALEIAKFQDQLIKRLNEDALLQLSHEFDADGTGAVAIGNGGGSNGGNSPATEAVLLHTHGQYGPYGRGPHEWNFAKAFLYSLTVLTTIGYGNIAPRTTLGRLVTLVYAIFGIPLTLVYLSSTGGILAKVAREVFSKALCCCLCSNCGYCCYDEKRMAEKERRMKRKRQQEELRKQQAAMQEPYYVRSGSIHDSYHTPEKQPSTPATTTTATATSAASGTPMLPPDIDSLSASESRGSMHGLSILAPILLCLSMMVIYIVFGAVVLYRLEDWPLLDGIYFCFMSLSTIGFGDMLPGLRRESTTTTWFCSIYIMSGMALTAMCFNVIHEEIVHRIKIVVEFKKGANVLDNVGGSGAGGGGGGSGAADGEQSYYMAT